MVDRHDLLGQRAAVAVDPRGIPAERRGLIDWEGSRGAVAARGTTIAWAEHGSPGAAQSPAWRNGRAAAGKAIRAVTRSGPRTKSGYFMKSPAVTTESCLGSMCLRRAAS